MSDLTDEQIENWRRVLIGIVGPYALMMTKAEICAMRDVFQERVDEGFEANDSKLAKDAKRPSDPSF